MGPLNLFVSSLHHGLHKHRQQ
uniref:Uncharacterized protein n=1 Tax=Rhizophora mucronata TaxID=61149 RepID=A0A2P2R0F7_RHIMU